MITTIKKVVLVVCCAALGACATTTEIVDTHPLFPESAEQPVARVYFIRPEDQRSRGVADAPLKVELNEVPALSLSSGEYALLRLKPGPIDIVVRNLTYMTAQANPMEVWRARRYNFEPGKIYYVLMKQDHMEFRGIYFVPELVEAAEAARAAEHTHPAGELAEQNPI